MSWLHFFHLADFQSVILLMLTYLIPFKHLAPPFPDKIYCICHLDRNCSIKSLVCPTPLLPAFVVNWKMTDSLHLHSAAECVTIRAHDFPTIVRALSDRKSSLGTHFAANLTICLLARSPTATRACTLNCCWRKTKKHCFPENTNNRLRQAVKKCCKLSSTRTPKAKMLLSLQKRMLAQ